MGFVRAPEGNADREQAVAVLAEAFSTDPAMRWFLPGDDARRARRLRTFFGALTRGEHVLRLTDDGLGAALWRAPGRWRPGPSEALRLLPAMLRTFARHPVRGVLGLRAVDEGHPRDPHWYLDYVAVSAAARGRGAGAALVRDGIARADVEGVGAYLNASTERSRRLYERHGFVVTEAYHLPFAGPRQFHMWREPR